MMFAYYKRDIAGNKASIKIADSKWSKVCSQGFPLSLSFPIPLLALRARE
jgi:hypothetical protein